MLISMVGADVHEESVQVSVAGRQDIILGAFGLLAFLTLDEHLK